MNLIFVETFLEKYIYFPKKNERKKKKDDSLNFSLIYYAALGHYTVLSIDTLGIYKVHFLGMLLQKPYTT